jgi:hypothetical protein
MSQFYFDPTRATDPHALPDGEAFYADDLTNEEGEPLEAGWYWWTRFPGCMPDGEPSGPFATEADAIADAQEGA